VSNALSEEKGDHQVDLIPKVYPGGAAWDRELSKNPLAGVPYRSRNLLIVLLHDNWLGGLLEEFIVTGVPRLLSSKFRWGMHIEQAIVPSV
jgi:hypothetical protein